MPLVLLVLTVGCTGTGPPDPVYVTLDAEAMVSGNVEVPVVGTNGSVAWDWSGVTEDRNGEPTDPTAYDQITDTSYDDVAGVDPHLCGGIDGAASSGTGATDGETSESSLYPHGFGAIHLSGGGQPNIIALASTNTVGSARLGPSATLVLDAEALAPQAPPEGANAVDWSALGADATGVQVLRVDGDVGDVARGWLSDSVEGDRWVGAGAVGTRAQVGGPDQGFDAWTPDVLYGEASFGGLDDGALWVVSVEMGECQPMLATFQAP